MTTKVFVLGLLVLSACASHRGEFSLTSNPSPQKTEIAFKELLPTIEVENRKQAFEVLQFNRVNSQNNCPYVINHQGKHECWGSDLEYKKTIENLIGIHSCANSADAKLCFTESYKSISGWGGTPQDALREICQFNYKLRPLLEPWGPFIRFKEKVCA